MQIKTIDDYFEQLYKEFPEVPKSDIKKAARFGWKRYYLFNSYGADVTIKNTRFWSHTGFLRKDPLKHFKYYIRKLLVKLKIMYAQDKTPYTGYYYFALSESQYQKYLSQIHQRGRPRKYFKFDNIFLYKEYLECSIANQWFKYIFKIKYPIYLGPRCFIKNAKFTNIELIETRKPLTFKDILVDNINKIKKCLKQQ